MEKSFTDCIVSPKRPEDFALDIPIIDASFVKKILDTFSWLWMVLVVLSGFLMILISLVGFD